MTSLAIPSFAITMLFSLVLLAKWKRRHDTSKRMKRGLTSYVNEKSTAPKSESSPQSAVTVG